MWFVDIGIVAFCSSAAACIFNSQTETIWF